SDRLGQPRAVPAPDPATGLLHAGWPVTDELPVEADWTSGYYLAEAQLLQGPAQGAAAVYPFVVRPGPGSRSALLVQVPVNTWEAYSPWGGRSLYAFNSPRAGPANRVAFDRPYDSRFRQLTLWELPLVRFLEREGYDVAYQADVDTDRNPASLLAHRAVIVA